MANKFYDTASTGASSPYETTTTAATKLADILTAAPAVDEIIWVKSTSVEGYTANTTYASPSSATAAKPQRLFSTADWVSSPGSLTAGAVINNSSGNYFLAFYGYWHLYGIDLSHKGTGVLSNYRVDLHTTAGSGAITLDTCIMGTDGTGLAASSTLGPLGASNSTDAYVTIADNLTWRFGNSAQTIAIGQGYHKINNLILAGNAVPTTLFSIGNTGSALIQADVTVTNSDLTNVAWTNIVDASSNHAGALTFINCKFPASYTVNAGASWSPFIKVKLINCTSGDVGYAYQKHNYAGSVITDTGKYISGSAMVDGGTPISRKLTASSNCARGFPLTTKLLYPVDNDASIQPWVEITSNVTLTDVDCWITVDVMDNNGNTLGSKKTTYPGLIASGTTLTTSSASWISGSTYNYKIQLGAAVTARQNQLIRITVNLAKSTGSPVVYVGDYGV